MGRWYAVYTHPQAETRAAVHLREQGFEPYLPRFLKRRSHARRVEWGPSPLFPRYLFVGMDVLSARWRAIYSTPGVVTLVSDGRGPVAVPNGVVEEIMARHDDRGLVHLPQGPRQGERVRVLDGPLEGLHGLFACNDDNGRVTVLLDLLGRATRVSLPLAAVAAEA